MPTTQTNTTPAKTIQTADRKRRCGRNISDISNLKWMALTTVQCLALSTALAAPVRAFDTTTLVGKVMQAKIFKPNTPLSIDDVGEGGALVTTVRSAKATDKDCEIDALLVSMKLMEASKDIKRVAFYSFGDDDTLSDVLIRETDVKAYTGKAINVSDLLSSIDVHHSGRPDKLSSVILKTDEGREIVALGTFVSALRTLAGMAATGFDTANVRPAIITVFGLLEQKEFLPARVQAKQLGHRANCLKLLVKPTNTPAVSKDAKIARDRAQNMLRDVAGLEAPLRGKQVVDRCVLLAMIREAEKQDVDIKDVHKMYLDLQDSAVGASAKDTPKAIENILLALKLAQMPHSHLVDTTAQATKAPEASKKSTEAKEPTAAIEQSKDGTKQP